MNIDISLLYIAGCITTALMGILLLFMDTYLSKLENNLIGRDYWLYLMITLASIIIASPLILILYYCDNKIRTGEYTMLKTFQAFCGYLFIAVVGFIATYAGLTYITAKEEQSVIADAPYQTTELAVEDERSYYWIGKDCQGGKVVQQRFDDSQEALDARCKVYESYMK